MACLTGFENHFTIAKFTQHSHTRANAYTGEVYQRCTDALFLLTVPHISLIIFKNLNLKFRIKCNLILQMKWKSERKNLYWIYLYYEILQFWIYVVCGSFSERRRNNFLWLNPDFLKLVKFKFKFLPSIVDYVQTIPIFQPHKSLALPLHCSILSHIFRRPTKVLYLLH